MVNARNSLNSEFEHHVRIFFMVLTISDEEIQQMQAALLDKDGKEALRLLKEFMKRLDKQRQSGMRSHLG